MELHNRFVDIAVSESSVLESILDSCVSEQILHSATIRSIDECMGKLKTCTFSDKDLKNLRLLLCQQYSSVYYKSGSNKLKFTPEPSEILSILTSFEIGGLRHVHVLVGDIIILLLALLEYQKDLILTFQDFRSVVTNGSQEISLDIADDWYLKILDCFLQTWRIFDYVKDDGISLADLDSNKNLLLLSIISDVEKKVTNQQTEQYAALHALSCTITKVTHDSDILCKYFSKILQEDSSLSIVCVLSDLLFPAGSSSSIIDYNSIFPESFLTTIQTKLISGQSDERKQALFIFKKIHHFVDSCEQNIRKGNTEMNQNIEMMNLSICGMKNEFQLPQTQTRINFIIMMEALEEKQKHLVIPTLSLVDSFIASSVDEKTDGELGYYNWLHCIFSRILAHDNNAVVKWGLLKILQLNAKVYDHPDLIALLVRSLNNTFLYENQTNDSEPKIVTSLTEWFNNCESENSHLIAKFLDQCVEEMWCPVAIYYVLQSLSRISDKLCGTVNLEQNFFRKMKTLIERNIKFHPTMLRLMSQIMLIKVLVRLFKIQNLHYVSDLLSVLEIDSIESSKVLLVPWFATLGHTKVSKFVIEISKSLFINGDVGTIDIPTFSLVIELLYEAKVIFQPDTRQATQALMDLLSNLSKADSRPYVNFEAQIKIIEFLHHLLSSKSVLPKYFYDFYKKERETIFRVILKLFHNNGLSYDHVKICTKVLQSGKHIVEPGLELLPIIADSNRQEMEKKCVNVICNAQQHTAVQILLAVQVWSGISNQCNYEEAVVIDHVNNLLKLCQNEKYKKEFTGKLATDYYTAISKIMRNHVKPKKICREVKVDQWLQIMSHILDAAGNQVLVYFGEIMMFLTDVIVNNDEYLDKFKDLIRSFWRCNFGSKRERTFWLVAQKLTKCINSSNFLKHEALQDVSEEFTRKMMSEGDSLRGLKLILLLCSDLKSHYQQFIDVILDGLLQGQVMRRDQRITMQACEKGSKLLPKFTLEGEKLETFEIYDFINRQSNVDGTIRAAAVLCLMNILGTDASAASMILPLVLEKFAAVQNKRYYADSQVHRLKQRTLQVLLILQPFLKNEESIQILYHILKISTIQDSDQHSVRMMKEWLLTRIYLCNENILNDFWSFFDEIHEKRPGSISSIISVIWHVALHMKKEKSADFIDQALTKLEICCMGQQFNMRFFSQFFYIKLFNLFEPNNEMEVKHGNFLNAISKSLDMAKTKLNLSWIEDNFFFTNFDPVKHYDLETLYHQLPRLSNVSSEEWVMKEDFTQLMCLHSETSGFLRELQVVNPTSMLPNEKIPDFFLKSGDKTRSEEVECFEDDIDFQRKLKTWKRISPTEKDVLEMESSSDSTHKLMNKEDMIVVASLVDKSQNLGGIARTCEIFGVRELVISNLKQIEDKEFQALSVSADRWINISEVKQVSLVQYLMDLKSHGWTLIGAEQTAQSVSLVDLEFPKQTILILGNEKSGIPAHIIPMLDLCVEIPQAGVIRSLNVHVTSAICIWEYIKQHGLMSH
ncbi:hypothetical protein QAD02_001103 [Eretmocerus hayati]|uniref:Uncharacterized protein n=1 Tax=Eretmocerus hayati TaxID=131215 RepID=A0ACC2NHM7_9HYME|nr:hypothetical protein QAD02_001103 [Eretmocerus hayati]